MMADPLSFETVIFDHVNDAVMLTDLNFRVVRWNPAAERLYGWSAAEVVGRLATDIIPILRYPGVQSGEEVWAAFQHNSFWQGDVVQRHRDGHELVIESSVRLVRDDQQTPHLIVAINRDITERWRADEALREQEAYYRVLIEQTTDAVVVFEPDGSPRYSNLGMARMLGYDPEDQRNGSFLAFVHPDDVAAARQMFASTLQTPESTQSAELRVRHKTGAWRVVDVTLRNLVADPAVRGVVLTGHDVTARKEADAAIRTSEERFRLVFELSPDGMWLLDPYAPDNTWPIVDCNDAAARMHGYTREELLGQPIDMFNANPAGARPVPDYDEAWWRVGREQAEDIHRRKDGSLMQIEYSTALVSLGGRELLLAVERDVTARKQTEAALRESEERWRILSELTSDFSYAYLVLPDDTIVRQWTTSAFTRITGFTPEEMDARGWEALPVVEDREFVEGRGAAIRAGRPHTCEYRIRTRQGELRWLRDYVRPVPGDLHGGAIQVYGAAQDITARKHAEQSLREGEGRLAGAQRLARLGSWEWDIAADRLTWSDELYRIFGVEPQEFAATYEAYVACIHPDDRERITQNIARGLRTPAPLMHTYRIIRRDGIERVVQGSVDFVVDERGQLVKLVGTTQDVTEQQQAEDRIRRESARAEALLRVAARLNAALEIHPLLEVVCEESAQALNAPIAVVGLYDSQGDVVTFEHGVGVPSADRQRLQTLLHTLSENDTRSPGHVVIADVQNGSGRPGADLLSMLGIRSAAVVDMARHGERVGVLLVASAGAMRSFSDDELALLHGLADQAVQAITNARLFDQLRMSGERLRRLTREVMIVQEEERRRLSRELHDETGQALTGLKLSLTLIQAHVPPESRTAHRRLREGIALVETTMDQIRLLARDLRPAALDTVGLNLTLGGYCQSFARRTGLAIEYSGTEVSMLPDMVAIALYRLVQEGLTNVARHGGATGVCVVLQEDPERITVSITDNGHGFDPCAVLGNVHPSGMGLAGMRERIGLLGGALEIDSRPGQCTRLVARIPRGEPV